MKKILFTILISTTAWADEQLKIDFSNTSQTLTESLRTSMHNEFLRLEAEVDKQAKEKDLKQKTSDLENLKKTIAQETKNVVTYKKEIPQMENKIVSNQQVIQKKQQELPQLKADLKEAQKDLQPDEDLLSEKEFQLQKMIDDVSFQDKKIKNVESEISNLNNQIDEPDVVFEDFVDSLSEADYRIQSAQTKAKSDASYISQYNNGSLPDCINRRLNNFEDKCDSSYFIGKQKQEIESITNELSQPNLDPNKKSSLENKKYYLQYSIQYCEHIVKIFNYRDFNLVPIRKKYLERQDIVDYKNKLQNDANTYESKIVQPIRARVAKLKAIVDQKADLVDSATYMLNSLKSDNTQLASGIDFRKKRLIELEGPNGNDGLIKQWTDINLPQYNESKLTADQAMQAAQKAFNDKDNDYKKSFDDVLKLQTQLQDIKTKLYQTL